MKYWKALLFLVLIQTPTSLTASTASAEELIIIVNSDNPATQISAQDLTDFYLKRKRQWPDSTPIRFVDRADASPERQQFLSSYIKKSARDMELFWIGQKLYTGDSAPIQVGSDTMIMSLVARFKGGISYLSSKATLAKGVKKIDITGAH